nr:MAG TPA: hypothetical protein [Bacteriophage sp.]
MLIRSQNREVLINLNSMAGAEIAEGPIKTIITSYITGCSYLLGEYSDKAKAMKVLDMIQEAYADFEASKITNTGLATAAYTGSYKTPDSVSVGIKVLKGYAEMVKESLIFQMPEDLEVEV